MECRGNMVLFYRKSGRIIGWQSAYIDGVVLDYSTTERFPQTPDLSFAPSWTVKVKVVFKYISHTLWES